MQEFQENWRTILDEDGYDDVRLERVLIDPKRKRIVARFSMDTLPPPGREQALRRALMKRFPQCTVNVRVSCQGLSGDMCAHPDKYAEYLIAQLLERTPGAAPFLRAAQWEVERGELLLYTQGEAGASYLVERGCTQVLSTVLKDVFKLDMNVRAVAREEELPGEEEQREMERHMVRKITEELATNQKKARELERARERSLYGGKVSGTATSIGELTDASGVVIIDGQVLSQETRLLKGGERMLVTFGVTDFTGSILVKAFIDPSEEKKFSQLAPGEGVRVRGECRDDTFAKEVAIMAKDIMLVPIIQRKDAAEVKRVELHLHTQMSMLDGVSAPDALIRRAAAWGQEAVAITDHGVVQAFPEAFDTVASLNKKGNSIKFIPGMEGYLVDDRHSIVRNADDGRIAGRAYVVLDVETTGLNPQVDRLTEVAAVRIQDGRIVDEFSTFVDPGMPIPAVVVEKTGITDEMVHGAPSPQQVVRDLAAFLQNDVLAAHNASFDMAFLNHVAREIGVTLPATVIDTLQLSRALLPDQRYHKLNLVCKALGVPLKNAHRAVQDAKATAKVLEILLGRAIEHGAETLIGVNEILGQKVAAGSSESYHIVLLAATRQGLFNLYKLTSIGHMRHFYRRPRLPRSVIQAHREGLILGAACESGELFQAILSKRPQEQIEEIAKFYDYLEIQPTGNNAFLVREGAIADDDGLRELNRAIVKLGEKLNIPVCATCDVHFLDPEDAIFREILMQNKHFSDAAYQAPLYMRTTGEMLEEFAYLGEEKAYEVVVTNTRAIAARVEQISMFPKHPRNELTFQPTLPDAELIVERSAWQAARDMYGEELPDIVRARVEKELRSIIGNGFGTLYRAAQLLVEKSMNDGYLVGSRGSVGSSFVATLIGITEINPLQPHYRCPACKYSDFEIDLAAYPCGVDLPTKKCPVCSEELIRDGYDIPFEVFLGFEGDKVPDIDLNFSGVYQPQAQAFVKSIFGENNVFKAGTIGTLAEKKAYGEVLAYLNSTGKHATKVERERLVKGITGVKVTTGQHPGGMVVVPQEYDIHSFSPIQHPADKKETGIVTTHFDFGSLHDILVKLDILGHDDPTMIYMLEKLTGIQARDLPLTDPKVISLFSSTEALGVSPEQIGSKTGTLGIPEFGTKFVRGMLEETRPTTMDELVRISGLSHGTNVWLNNAQDMIQSGIATLKTCFCTRADIMNTLIARGVEVKTAFTIMELVRKGKGKTGLTPAMFSAMREAGVEEHYIDSLLKIEYLFPRAHAAAYVKMALRVAYFKVYVPLAYYTAYFTVRADEFDAAMMLAPPEGLRATMKELEADESDSAKNERLITLLELVLEMRERGIDFAPVDLYLSSADEFLIQGDMIRPPLNRLPGVGLAAAQAIVDARADGEFLSIEELQSRTKVSRAVVDQLRQMGCLTGMAQSSQVTLF